VSNLGEGLVEETKSEIIMNMHELGMSLDLIAKSVKLDEETVKRIIKENEPAYV
jgi:predicted transposase YdaD